MYTGESMAFLTQEVYVYLYIYLLFLIGEAVQSYSNCSDRSFGQLPSPISFNVVVCFFTVYFTIQNYQACKS